MIIARALLCILINLCSWQIIWCAKQYRIASEQERSSIDIKDKIIDLQCYAKCEKSLSNAAKLQQCREQCKIDSIKSPRRGYCPNRRNVIFHNIAPLQKLSCLNNCNYDADCSDVQKCCDSTCGPVCMEPIGLRDDSLLPPIPKILKFKLPRGHKVEIEVVSSANSTYYCHIEARYHIGLLFSPRKLGMWQWQPVEKIAEISDTRNKRTYIAFNLRPGRWYQVRVAAINAYGFRGYSEPSKAFTLSNHPKPPKPPADLKVIATQFDGTYCTVKIAWCPSKSNLPIEKYKIIWSLYVKSKEESFISNESYVKDSHQFEIHKLLPDSSYYIQVQAMSISGSRRLKSDKISLLYNTTTVNTAPSYLTCGQEDTLRKCNILKALRKENISSTIRPIAMQSDAISLGATVATTRMSPEGEQSKLSVFNVRFRMNRKFGMIVQITGFHSYKEKVYELCPKDTNCEQREYSAIRAKKNSLEFSKLKYNTTYMLKAFKADGENLTDSRGFYTFTTPKCENFRKRFPKMQIKCP